MGIDGGRVKDDHVIDRKRFDAGEPLKRGFGGILDHGSNLGYLGGFATGDPSRNVAVEQHVEHLLSARRTYYVLRLDVVLEVPAFVRHVRDAVEINAVLGTQNAANPHAGRLRIRPYAD